MNCHVLTQNWIQAACEEDMEGGSTGSKEVQVHSLAKAHEEVCIDGRVDLS